MREFDFISDGWLTMEGGDDPAICATFAALQIRARNEYVTYVEEKSSQSTAHHILVPLHPVAEWIVANWWALTEESQVPNRADYWERHSLARGREGFAFPDLRIIPEGSVSRIEWRPWATRHMNLNFLSGGEMRLPTETLRQILGDFVDKVIGRLRARQIPGTWLEREWRVIQGTAPDELEFCRSAAWLGLDPYGLSAAQAASLIHSHDRLPLSLREEALRAASFDVLTGAAAWIQRGALKLPELAPNGALAKIRRKQGAIPALQQLPWEDGYRLARELRKHLKARDAIPFSMDLVTGAADPVIAAPAPPVDSFDGLCGVTKDRELRCYTARTRPQTRRFTAARGILEWIYGEPGGPIMLTSATTQRQQRNRAFAAELLAPSDLIRQRLRGAEIDATQLQDLGDAFDVSPWVVEHQIRNHRLAALVC